MKPLNVAVVGCGAVHGVHIKAIKKMEHVKLYAVCDTKEPRAKACAELYDCKYYTDFDEMLADQEIDAVHICTPHYLHQPMILKALVHKKHIFCEKPLGLNSEECAIIKQSVQDSEVAAGICLQNRLNPTSIVMKSLIERGDMGVMKGIRGFVSWHRNAAYYLDSDWRGRKVYEGGGLLMNQMIHTVDLMQWFCEGVAQLRGHVSTRLLEDVIDEEDTAEATFWMNNGAIGHFYATNCYTMDAGVLIEVHFEKGILRISDSKLIKIQNGTVEELISDQRVAHEGKQYWGNAHEVAIHQFYQGILNQIDEYIQVSEGVKSVAICQAIYQSSEQGGTSITISQE